MENKKIYYHLPGLFEFYEFYKVFLPLFKERREWFYEWCEISSIYGAPEGCLWGGGRTSNGVADARDVLSLMEEYSISPRLTFSNCLLEAEHLDDERCNELCVLFSNSAVSSGAIVASDLLTEYLRAHYPDLYLVSSTTKVITDFSLFTKELERSEFRYVVPDFRLNKKLEQLSSLDDESKMKVEFLCNECCWFGCKDRKACYENVSALNLGRDCSEFICQSPSGDEGYRFSLAKKNPGFISVEDIVNVYGPLGFRNFKIEGRGLGSAMILEFLLYYMTKPEYQLNVREEIYLDGMLDLF